MKMIAEYHDRGEALCSHQDTRGEHNSMYNRHHSEESKNKNRLSNMNYLNTGGTWYESLNKNQKDIHKKISSKAAKGKVWIYKDDICKYILPEELNDYIKIGWIKGRPSYIISKGNKNRDWSKVNVKRTKSILIHNDIEKTFDCMSDLYEYCLEHYSLSSGTVKHLLNTEEVFVPHYMKHTKAKGLKLKRI